MALDRTFPCSKDAWLVDSGDGAGNGRADHVTVGRVDGKRTRAVFEFDPDYSLPGDRTKRVLGVNRAYLRLTVRDVPCISQGGNVQFWIEELTDGFQEGTYGAECSWAIDNAAVFPGPASTTSRRVKYDPGSQPSSGSRIRVEITAQLQHHFANNPNRPFRIRLIAADSSNGYDENDASHTVSFRSRHMASGRPSIEVVLEDNHAPGPPTILSPVPPTADADTLVEGLVLSLEVERTDEDPGDYITGTEVQAWTETSTMDDQGVVTGGTRITGLDGARVGEQKTTYTGQPTRVVHTVSGWSPGQRAKVRVRTRDRRGTWGADSGTAHGWSQLLLFDVNSRPTEPTNLVADTTSPTPDYSGSHNDPDPGSSVSAVQTQVRKETTQGIELIMNATAFVATTSGGFVGDEGLDAGPYSTRNGSGAQTVAGGTAWVVPHQGRALVVGEVVSRRHRTVDQFGRVGLWSGWVSWTVGVATAPLALPVPGVKQDTLTPNIGATHSSHFDRIHVRGWTDAIGGSLLRDTGEVTVSPVALSKVLAWPTPGTAVPLQWGQTVWLERRVRDNATKAWTPWSPREPMPIDSLPLAPLLEIEGATARADGTWVIGTRTPRIRVTFRDPDLPTDAPSRRIIRIRTSAAGVPIHTSDIGSGITDTYDVPGSTLAWETTYWITGQHADSAGQLGPESAAVQLFVHQPPDVALGDGPDTDDPTPVIDWDPTFHGDASQDRVEIAIRRLAGFANRAIATYPDSYWRLAEPSGPFYDVVGSANGTGNGTLTRNVTGALDPVDTDGAVELDGSSGYIDFGDVHDLAGTAPFTLACFVKPDTLTSTPRLLNKIGTDGGGTQGWSWHIESNGTIRLQRWQDGANDMASSAVGAVVTGAWQWLVAKFDGTTMTLKVDDVVTGTPAASTKAIVNHGVSMKAGRHSNGASNYLDGRMDALLVWSRATTDAEDTAIHQARTQAPAADEIHRDTVTTADETYTVPGGILRTGEVYDASVLVCDTAGLCTELSREVSVPAAATFALGAATFTAAAEATTAGVADGFTRSVSDGWGSADTGGAYSLSGSAADHDTTGSRGTIALSAAGVQRIATLPDASIADGTFSVLLQTDKLAVGGPIHVAILARVVLPNSWYLAYLDLGTDQVVRLKIDRLVGGAATALASVALSAAHVTGTDWHLELEVTGSNPTVLRAKAWKDGDSEPGSWDLETSDSSAALQGAGHVGLRALLFTGATNAPVTVSFDDFEVT